MKNALIASLLGLAATQNDFDGFGGNQAKDSQYSGVWYKFKGLKDKSGKLLPRFVRRAKLKAYVKG
ncbi:hypothetical protein [Campylobacter sp. RM9328]|uniref:hypothetical protein n=1 Tax=Campylobacter sp. RM9328 TaxID=1705720 RepID=UPI0014737DE2|nr:hypothetical protein [Campylobacter sp. RM9328]